MNIGRIYSFIAASLALATLVCGCSKSDDATFGSNDKKIEFGVSAGVTSRVTVSESANSNGKYDITFDKDDKIGVYLYYNNFFKYYGEYNSYAESVIFANQLLTVNSDGKSVGYAPLKSWTFSTLYGTEPYKYDAIAYYPYTEVSGVVDKWSDGASNLLAFNYNPSILERHCDFMIASATYSGSDNNSSNFRNEILNGKTRISFKFSRQMAGMNIGIAKSDKLKDSTIVIEGLTCYFDCNNRFLFDQSAQSGEWGNSDGTTSKKSYSVVVIADSLDSNVTTLQTVSDGATDDGTGDDTVVTPDDVLDTAVRLSANLMKSELYFPPKTEITKIVFDLKVNGKLRSYMWHPHVKEIVANTTFILNIELDPERLN